MFVHNTELQMASFHLHASSVVTGNYVYFKNDFKTSKYHMSTLKPHYTVLHVTTRLGKTILIAYIWFNVVRSKTLLYVHVHNTTLQMATFYAYASSVVTGNYRYHTTKPFLSTKWPLINQYSELKQNELFVTPISHVIPIEAAMVVCILRVFQKCPNITS